MASSDLLFIPLCCIGMRMA